MKYRLGKRITELLNVSDKVDKSVKDSILNSDEIRYEELVEILKNESKNERIMYYLSDMKPIFEIYEDKVRGGEKSPEFIKLMEKLQKEEDEKNYRTLINRGMYNVIENEVDGIGKYKFLKEGGLIGYNKENSIGTQAKEMKHQITTIFNIMITVVSVGYAVWYWSGSSMNINNGNRILLSLFSSILVLVAEVVVFGGYLRKVEEARDKERKVVERKQVLETLVLGKGGKGGKRKQV